MKITQKSQEVIQAQIASYGDYMRPDDNLRALEVTEHAMQLARGEVPTSMHRVIHFVDEQGIHSSAPRMDYEHANYLAFLRKQAKEASTPAYLSGDIAMRTQLLTAYALFRASVSPIVEEVSRFNEVLLPASERAVGYITFGTLSDAYELQQNENAYVVRVLRARPGRVDKAYVQGALRALDIPAAEKLVAVSYEDGVTIAKKMPGTCLNKITSSDLAHVTKEQVRALTVTIHSLMNAGISLDLAPGNVLYDPTYGFGVIDLQASADRMCRPVPMIQAVRRTETALGYILGGSSASYDPKEYPLLKEQLERIDALRANVAKELVPDLR